MRDARELLATAAALVVDEGMEYIAAKRKAARAAGHRGELPSNEDLEDAVREHIAIFLADVQPQELQALRALALGWMLRLERFRPHLSGAAWRGTATRRSALMIDLYCDDPKAAEIELLNQGVDFDVGAWESAGRGRRGPVDVLSLAVALSCPCVNLMVTCTSWCTIWTTLRGALKPDARGHAPGVATPVERCSRLIDVTSPSS
jgi:hypothetical protein